MNLVKEPISEEEQELLNKTELRVVDLLEEFIKENIPPITVYHAVMRPFADLMRASVPPDHYEEACEWMGSMLKAFLLDIVDEIEEVEPREPQAPRNSDGEVVH